MSPEVTLTRDRVLSLFESNPMRRLNVLDVNLTLASITVANTLLEVNLISYLEVAGLRLYGGRLLVRGI